MRHKSTVYNLEIHNQFDKPLDKRKAEIKGKTDFQKESREGQSVFRVNRKIKKG